jgi:hypothetical protein
MFIFIHDNLVVYYRKLIIDIRAQIQWALMVYYKIIGECNI